MVEHPLEFFGNSAVLHSAGRVCETPEDLLRSAHFRQILDAYLDGLSRHHSMLLDIFGKEPEQFASRIKSFFEVFRPGAEDTVIQEKREITEEERDLLVETLVLLVKLKAEEIPGVKGARLTGAGWGGCIVALVPVTSVETFVSRVPQGYQRATGLRAEAFVCSAGHGASRVTEYTRS